MGEAAFAEFHQVCHEVSQAFLVFSCRFFEFFRGMLFEKCKGGGLVWFYRAVDNFYSLGGHNRSECQCGLNFIGMPCTYKPTCIHNLI